MNTLQERLRTDVLSRLSGTAHEAAERIDADAERIKALEADAERYRWLRSPAVGPSAIWELVSDDAHPPHLTLKCGADLDTAIDAARSKT